MRKYRDNASSTVRIEYGIELHAGLSQFAETQPAAAELLTINEALAAQQNTRLALRAPELKARAIVRFSEYNVDKVIRSAHRAAEIEDGGRRGKISIALFPNGLTPVVRPSGQAQVKPTKELIDRLVLTKVPGIDAYRAVWQAKLEAALTQLTNAIAEHETSRAAHDDAFNAELALREAHLDVVDKITGLVRAAFPRDRTVQDVVFPILAEVAAKKARAAPPAGNDPSPRPQQLHNLEMTVPALSRLPG